MEFDPDSTQLLDLERLGRILRSFASDIMPKNISILASQKKADRDEEFLYRRRWSGSWSSRPRSGQVRFTCWNIQTSTRSERDEIIYESFSWKPRHQPKIIWKWFSDWQIGELVTSSGSKRGIFGVIGATAVWHTMCHTGTQGQSVQYHYWEANRCLSWV